MQNEPVEVTLKVTGIFEKFSIPYLIGGSLASALYGMIRTTQDSGVIAEMRLNHLQPFVSALQDEFYMDDEMINKAILSNTSFNIIHRQSMFKVDVFIPRQRPFLQSQLARAQKQTFLFESEVSAKFCSPEDIVLVKLEWYRMDGEASDRQWRDVLGVLKTRAGELDLNYLRKWADELQIDDLFERAMRDSIEDPE